MRESSFSQDEEAVIANLIAEDAAANGGPVVVGEEPTAPPPPAEATAPSPAVSSPAPAPLQATTPAPAPTPPADSAPAPQPGGDVRAALRASRHDARAERERRIAAEEELARLRNAAPPPPPADNGLTDEELAELRADLPAVGKLADEVVRLRKSQAAAPPPPAPAAPAPTPGFVPPIVDDPDVQGAIDENPDLLAWQYDPTQTAWRYAVAQDDLLRVHPVWGTKSLPERLAEVTRRVKAELTPSSRSPTPDEIAAAAVAAATARAPNTLSDITGAGSPKTPAPGLEQFMKMKTDEEILDAAAMFDARGGG